MDRRILLACAMTCLARPVVAQQWPSTPPAGWSAYLRTFDAYASADSIVGAATLVMQDGRVVQTYHKHALPNYTVFDEERYFEADDEPCILQIQGTTLGVNICEDTWDPVAPRGST